MAKAKGKKVSRISIDNSTTTFISIMEAARQCGVAHRALQRQLNYAVPNLYRGYYWKYCTEDDVLG